MARFLWWLAEAAGFIVLNLDIRKTGGQAQRKAWRKCLWWVGSTTGLERLSALLRLIQQWVEWGLPAMLAIAVLLALHWAQTRYFSQATAQTEPVGPTLSKFKTNIVSQIRRRLYAQAKTVHSALEWVSLAIAWILIIACSVGLIGGIAMLAGGPRKIVPMAVVPRDSMLSGRPVSGIEIASRLERLEKEHATTVIELAATKEQLAAKNQELAKVGSSVSVSAI